MNEKAIKKKQEKKTKSPRERETKHQRQSRKKQRCSCVSLILSINVHFLSFIFLLLFIRIPRKQPENLHFLEEKQIKIKTPFFSEKKDSNFAVLFPSPHPLCVESQDVSCRFKGTTLVFDMEGDVFSGFSNGTQLDSRVVQTFQKSFVQVQDILDQNRLLINEINQNHESRIPDNLSRNVGLIKELNNNIRRVVDLYADLSSSFARSMEVSSEGDSSAGTFTFKSDGKATSQKRTRSG